MSSAREDISVLRDMWQGGSEAAAALQAEYEAEVAHAYEVAVASESDRHLETVFRWLAKIAGDGFMNTTDLRLVMLLAFRFGQEHTYELRRRTYSEWAEASHKQLTWRKVRASLGRLERHGYIATGYASVKHLSLNIRMVLP